MYSCFFAARWAYSTQRPITYPSFTSKSASILPFSKNTGSDNGWFIITHSFLLLFSETHGDEGYTVIVIRSLLLVITVFFAIKKAQYARYGSTALKNNPHSSNEAAVWIFLGRGTSVKGVLRHFVVRIARIDWVGNGAKEI